MTRFVSVLLLLCPTVVAQAAAPDPKDVAFF
jgi:hypothetical protein